MPRKLPPGTPSQRASRTRVLSRSPQHPSGSRPAVHPPQPSLGLGRAFSLCLLANTAVPAYNAVHACHGEHAGICSSVSTALNSAASLALPAWGRVLLLPPAAAALDFPTPSLPRTGGWPGKDAATEAWRRLVSWSVTPSGIIEQAPSKIARALQGGSSTSSQGSSTSIRPDTPTYPGETLVFKEDFSHGPLDTSLWVPEVTAGGFGNWEFQVYTQNVTNRHVQDGRLHLRPSLTADAYGGQQAVEGAQESTLDMWGTDPPSECTAPQWYGCLRTSNGETMLNPIMSARVRTAETFSFKYGRVEVRAKLPKGDWLWPAIWMLPRHQVYGPWPASGEIDIMESRGNAPGYVAGGHNTFGSTLHWGPSWDSNRWDSTHKMYTAAAGTSLADDFHTYGLLWTPTGLRTYIDSPQQVVLDVPWPSKEQGGMWSKGGWAGKPSEQWRTNPWAHSPTGHAPFDQEFYLIMNLAVGGTAGGAQGYFPDGPGKPWKNTDPHPMKSFWAAREQWLPSWGWVKSLGGSGGVGWVPGPTAASSSLVVESVHVWQSQEDGGSILPPHWGDRAKIMLAANSSSAGSRRSLADVLAEADASAIQHCTLNLAVQADLQGDGPCTDAEIVLA